MKIFENSIKLGYDLDKYEGCLEKEIVTWQPERHPMLLVTGATNSGKTYLLSSLMGKIVLSSQIKSGDNDVPQKSQLFLCDFKDIDFRDYENCSRRWSYEGCLEGLTKFYESFQARLSGDDLTTHRKFLIFDEWAGFVLSCEKKTQDSVKNMLSTLLMVGRGVNHHVIIGLQRADSNLFPNGGREQFGAILALGNLSREQKLMLFPDYREEMNTNNQQGQGYLYLDGFGLKRLQVPVIRDQIKLHLTIRSGLN
jgi:hypothetical protein